MTKLLCKLFRFFLNIFEQVVTVVAEALKTVGKAAIEVLDDLLTTASNALGLPKLALFAGVGLLAYWLLTGDDDEEENRERRPGAPAEALHDAPITYGGRAHVSNPSQTALA